MLSWSFIKNYFFSKRAGSVIRTVTWIGVVSVGLGVFSFIVVLSVMNGFNDSMKKKMLAIEPHLVVKLQNTSEVEALSKPEIVNLRENGAETDFYESQDIIVRTHDGYFGGGILRSIDKRILERVDEKWSKIDLASDEVLMGVDLGRSLRILDGDDVTLVAPEALLSSEDFSIPFQKVRVRLITTQVPEVDAHLVYYDRKKSGSIFNRSLSHESGVEIRLKDPNDYLTVQNQLKKNGVNSESWVDRNSSLFFALKVERFTMGFLLAMSALIASFSLVTVLILVITLKRRDIGILMTIGLNTKKTMGLFLRIGWFLSMIGIGWGLILGVSVVLYLQNYPLSILPDDVYIDSSIPARLDLWLIGATVLSALVIVSIAAWFPARVFLKLSPVHLLRQTGISKSRSTSLSDVF